MKICLPMPADQPPRQRVELSADAANTYDIRIARDGTWFHEGAPICRKALVKLFASVLWRDDGGYWMRTQAQQGRIEVEEAHFPAVELSVKGEGGDKVLAFRHNLDDRVEAGPAQPLRMVEQVRRRVVQGKSVT